MHAAAVRRPRNILAVSAITLYRKWISPYKGFRCAHQAILGQGSCSAYGLDVFSTRPFREALSLMRKRLSECRETYEHAMSSESEEERERRRRGSSSGIGSDGTLLGLEACGDVGSASCDGIDACGGIHSCDVPDIGSCH